MQQTRIEPVTMNSDTDGDEEKKDTKLNINAPQFIPNKTGKLMLDTINEDDDEKEEKNESKPMKLLQLKWDRLPIKCAGTVQISRDLTENIIPSTIKENISNIYHFMDKSIALRTNRKSLKNETFAMINFDFHHKTTNEMLYCIIKKQNPTTNRGYSWIMFDRLFTKKEIISTFDISDDKELILPPSARNDTKTKQQIDDIHVIHNIFQTELIYGIVERTQWHRIPIYNKKNNKQKKVLYLTKKEFIKKVEYFSVHNTNINIIPIMIFNSNKEYWIEHIYIIKIDNHTHIGISMKYKPHRNRIEVTGIHLNKEYILNKHQLALPNHDCTCLGHFESDIDDLKIGNIDENKNRIKDLKKRHEIIAKENDINKKKINKLTKKLSGYKRRYNALKQLVKSHSINILNSKSSSKSSSSLSVHLQSIGTNTNIHGLNVPIQTPLHSNWKPME